MLIKLNGTFESLVDDGCFSLCLFPLAFPQITRNETVTVVINNHKMAVKSSPRLRNLAILF